MKAINISHLKIKLNEIAKSLYLEHGWQMPDGFRDKSRKNPLNYTRAEWQQALRIGRKPSNIKRELQESWAISDSKQSFSNALQEQGYYLAQGKSPENCPGNTNSEKNYPTSIQNISDMLFIEKPFNYLRIVLQ